MELLAASAMNNFDSMIEAFPVSEGQKMSARYAIAATMGSIARDSRDRFQVGSSERVDAFDSMNDRLTEVVAEEAAFKAEVEATIE